MKSLSMCNLILSDVNFFHNHITSVLAKMFEKETMCGAIIVHQVS